MTAIAEVVDKSTNCVPQYTVPSAAPHVGDRVRIERDEDTYPSKGTWPQFRGRTGTVVQINTDEYGVDFGTTRRRPDGSLHGDDVVTWFKVYEMTPALAAVRRAGGTHGARRGAGTRPAITHRRIKALTAP